MDPWCASDPLPECAFSDCGISGAVIYRENGVYSRFSMVHSGANRQFSRPVAASGGTWVAGDMLRQGDVESGFECSGDVLLVGDTPGFRSRWDRVTGDLAQALINLTDADTPHAARY